MIGRLTARRAWLGVAVVIVAALPWLLDTSYWRGILVLCAMNVLLALSLNLVIGYTGQLNLGQSAFFGIGAYVSTILVKSYGWNFWLAAVAAVGAAGLRPYPRRRAAFPATPAGGSAAAPRCRG